MEDPSVLVVGGGRRGWRIALALRDAGMDVTLIRVAPGDQPAPADDVGLDVREDTTLVGFEGIDRHVEAELSDGRVENVDVILALDDTDVRAVADPTGLWQSRLRTIVAAC